MQPCSRKSPPGTLRKVETVAKHEITPDCGCTVYYYMDKPPGEKPVQWAGPKLCRLHAAAPELLAALRLYA